MDSLRWPYCSLWENGLTSIATDKIEGCEVTQAKTRLSNFTFRFILSCFLVFSQESRSDTVRFAGQTVCAAG